MKYINDLDEVVLLLLVLGDIGDLIDNWDIHHHQHDNYIAILNEYDIRPETPEEDFIFWQCYRNFNPNCHTDSITTEAYVKSITKIKEEGYVTK